MSWADDEAEMRAAGAPDEAVAQELALRRAEMKEAGAPQEAFDAEFGKPPDMKPTAEYLKSHFSKMSAGVQLSFEDHVIGAVHRPAAAPTTPKADSESPMSAFAKGLQGSASGLAKSFYTDAPPPGSDGLGPNPSLTNEISAGIGQAVGDLPFMIAGGMYGAATGGLSGLLVSGMNPVGALVGSVIGAGAAGAAFPAAVRRLLMDHYAKGDFTDFSDWFHRMIPVAKGVAEEAGVGAVGNFVGFPVGAQFKAPLMALAAHTAASVGTMVTAGAALNGKFPSAREFVVAAVTGFGLAGVSHGLPKLMNIFAETGVHPNEVLNEMNQDPVLKAKILSTNVGTPEELRVMGDLADKTTGELPWTAEDASQISPSTGEISHEKGDISRLDKTTSELPVPPGETFVDPRNGDTYHEVRGKLVRKDADIVWTHEAEAVANTPVGPLSPEFPGGGAAAARSAEGDPHQIISLDDLFDTSSPPERPEPPMSAAQAEAAVEARIRKTRPAAPGRTMAQKYMDDFDVYNPIRLAEAAIDGANPLDNPGSAYQAARKLGAAKDAAKYSLETATFDVVTKKNTGTGLVDILDGFTGPGAEMLGVDPADRSKFDNLLVARRAVELSDRVQRARREAGEDPNPRVGDVVTIPGSGGELRGEIISTQDPESVKVWYTDPETGKKARMDIPIAEANRLLQGKVGETFIRNPETGVPLDAAKALVGASKGDLWRAKQFTDWRNRLMRGTLVASGVVSEAKAGAYENLNRDFVPFHRVVEAIARGAGSGRAFDPTKIMYGSDAMIESPINAAGRDAILFHAVAARNLLAEKLVNLNNRAKPGEAFLEKIEAPLQRIRVSAEEAAKALPLESPDERFRLGLEDFDIFRSGQERIRKDTLTWYNKGKPEHYKITNPDIAEAMLGMDREQTPAFLQMANKFTRALREGATLALSFPPAHFARSEGLNYLFSKNWHIPILDGLRGLGHVIGETEAYHQAIKDGAFLNDIDGMARYLREDAFDLSKKTGLVDGMWNLIRTPVELARTYRELAVRGPVMGEYLAALRNSKESAQAAFEARDVLDASRHGAKTMVLTGLKPFMNVGWQAMDRLPQHLRTESLANNAKLAGRAAALGALSVTLWWANHRDPRVQSMSRTERDFNFVFPTDDWQPVNMSNPALVSQARNWPPELRREVGGQLQLNQGTVYKFPKPWEMGLIFGSLPERVAERFFEGNRGAFQEFDRSMVDAFKYNWTPTAIQPMVEQWANKKMYNGAPLIPHHLEDELPAAQYTEYTSETAKAIARFIPTFQGRKANDPHAMTISPIVMENYLREWTGGAGMLGLKYMDRALGAAGALPSPDRPEEPFADNPFFRSFVVRYPQPAFEMQRFKERSDENARFMTSLQRLPKRDLDGAKQIFPEFFGGGGDIPQVPPRLAGITNTLHLLSEYATYIGRAKKIAPNDKRQLLEGIHWSMYNTAVLGHGILDKLEASYGHAPAPPRSINETLPLAPAGGGQ